MSKKQTQRLPVRIYQSVNQFALAAPLAGLEAEDIQITIDGKRVTIHAKQRGPRQDGLDLLRAEWNIGPYHRKINLPEKVDGSLANATYGNGVLVLTLPKTNGKPKSTRAEFTLEAITPTRGERVGHVGHEIMPTTTEERRAKRPAA
jgi:HSP20 family protein